MIEPEGRRGYSGSLLIPAVALVLLVAIIAVVAMMCTGGDSEGEPPALTPTQEVTPTIAAGTAQETALIAHVASTQAEYAGPCADADATADVGKVCSTYRGEREGVHAFVLGVTFSEGTEWAFVSMQGSAWGVVATMPITPESAAVPGIPWPLRVGAEVVVTGTAPQNCLNVRTEPAGQSVDCIAEGTPITLSAGPQEADGRIWWRVEGRDGWVAADYLRYPDATIDPEPTPTSAVPEDGTPEATATP